MIKGRYKPRTKLGSALILAVVLTSLLAIIGVMFIMMARVDKMATSAISENKELNFAVETIVAKISQELVLDVPGMPKGAEYYDYPDANNAWLASLEPYEKTTGNYYWRQISDVYNRFGPVELGLKATIIPDNQKPSDVGDSNRISGYPADADGDGVADSNWVIIPDMTSSKGKPIYAAIRIVDNGGMINVNTAYEFDPNGGLERIDGSSQLQINLKAFARGDPAPDADTIGELNVARGLPSTPSDVELSAYEDNLIWRIEDPCRDYLPFDISDELTIRGRYIIKQRDTITRLKRVWEYAFDRSVGYAKETPYTETGDLPAWFNKGYRHPSDASIQQYYNMPHISTTHNTDRIIDPNGAKMTNINTADVNALYNSIRKGLLDTNCPDVNVAAQMAVNLIDFRDSDSDVTVYHNPDNSKTYYGFESPCIYMSELAHKFKKDTVDPNIVYKSYAVELYKPYWADNDPCNWRLEVGSTSIPINNWTGNKQFYVIQDQNSNAQLDVNLGTTTQDASFAFTANTEISLQRPLPGGGYVTVDWYKVDPCIPSPWLSEDGSPHSVQRDIQPHKCIRRLWASVARNDDDDLGKGNTFVNSDPNVIQAHPEDKPFTNVGEIGMLFRKGAYETNGIGYNTDNDEEEEVRLDLADPNFQQLFKYLTVFDPTEDNIDNDGDGLLNESDPNKPEETPEFKIPGRININTAPWYVIAQLPWVSQRVGYNNPALAQAIVAYRDKLDLSSTGGPDYYHLGASNSRRQETGLNNLREAPGFASIGELNFVIGGPDNYRIDYYSRDYNPDSTPKDQAGFPDLTTPNQTTGDEAANDFEERDVIFTRMSNLVTVRSDVFTAYILVRIGSDGPQKRAIAILDRSNVYSPTDKVKIVALHPVPDPR